MNILITVSLALATSLIFKMLGLPAFLLGAIFGVWMIGGAIAPIRVRLICPVASCDSCLRFGHSHRWEFPAGCFGPYWFITNYRFCNVHRNNNRNPGRTRYLVRFAITAFHGLT